MQQIRATQPTVHAVCFSCFHNPKNSDMDYGIFNVRTVIDACSRTWGCMDAVRESALKVDSGRKLSCRTGESNLRRQRAGPMFHQLSYIPTMKDLWGGAKRVMNFLGFVGNAEFSLRKRLPEFIELRKS